MVMNANIMTMLRRWNVAGAKAKLSTVINESRTAPQLIENRGRPVAVVVGIDRYQHYEEQEAAAAGWRKFLELSEALRAGGGESLRIPARERRPSPFRSPAASRPRSKRRSDR